MANKPIKTWTAIEISQEFLFTKVDEQTYDDSRANKDFIATEDVIEILEDEIKFVSRTASKFYDVDKAQTRWEYLLSLVKQLRKQRSNKQGEGDVSVS